MKKEINELWPELEWILNEDLRLKVAKTWELALERSVLSIDDLKTIPFTLLVKDLNVSFMAHKRSVVHIAREAGMKMKEFFGKDLPVDMDVLIAGVILAEECGVPPEVCHIIAAHAGEGDKIKRTTEAYIVHHADFMTFLPFKERLEV